MRIAIAKIRNGRIQYHCPYCGQFDQAGESYIGAMFRCDPTLRPEAPFHWPLMFEKHIAAIPNVYIVELESPLSLTAKRYENTD